MTAAFPWTFTVGRRTYTYHSAGLQQGALVIGGLPLPPGLDRGEAFDVTSAEAGKEPEAERLEGATWRHVPMFETVGGIRRRSGLRRYGVLICQPKGRQARWTIHGPKPSSASAHGRADTLDAAWGAALEALWAILDAEAAPTPPPADPAALEAP